MRVIIAATCIFLAIALPLGAAPAPIPHATQTPPPDVAASPTPPPLAISGEIVDLERGFIVYASGDAFRLSPDVRIVDVETRLPPAFAVEPGVYALSLLDGSTSLVVEVDVSRRPIAGGSPPQEIPLRYVARASSSKPNPDLAPPPVTYVSRLSKTVAVSITVEVPPDTPFGDDVYMATASSGWNPLAIRMQRVDGRRFRIAIDLAGGTDIRYLFTRGSFRSVERDRAGLERPARHLFVPGGDAMTVNATVQRWADLP